uniref:Uncharacterized protein n=1 Tax=Eutreptiella gymnastica TaxID=73025 RepID=A0A7S4CLG7_9EUGL
MLIVPHFWCRTLVLKVLKRHTDGFAYQDQLAGVRQQDQLAGVRPQHLSAMFQEGSVRIYNRSCISFQEGGYVQAMSRCHHVSDSPSHHKRNHVLASSPTYNF